MDIFFVSNSDSISGRVRVNAGPGIRSFICVSIVMMLACLAGCQRVQPTADSETSPEPLQTSEMLLQNAGAETKDIRNIQTCGSTTLNANDAEKWECVSDHKLICKDSHGCACGNTSCRFHDTCMLNEGKCIAPDRFECEDKNGCSCGTITCTEYENCIPAENKCINRSDGTFRTTNRPILSNTTWKEENATCSNDNGCKCGSQLCPKDFACIDEVCFYKKVYGDGSDGHYAFYCDKPEGCACSNHPVACPQGSVCDYWVGDQNWTSGFGYRCLLTHGLKDEKSVFEFLKGGDEHDFLHNKFKKTIYSETYYGSDTDVALRQNYFLSEADGKSIGWFVVCSQPGCDCNGVPLLENYLCVEQHVVFAHDKSDEYGICKWPYYGFSHDRPEVGGSCDIADNVIEQVCFNDQGCACGSDVIRMGDICVDGRAQCSALKPRPGCKCGGEKPGTGYGCYQQQLICQDKSCTCHGKAIHLGDICTKGDKNCNANHHLTTDTCVGDVICGADSQTTGCMCGEKALREGYRCFQKEQVCACHIPNEEIDDFEDTESDADRCTCQCGEQNVPNGAVCGNDDKPVSDRKTITFDETQCGKVDNIVYPQGEWVHYKSRKYEVDRGTPELAWLACTCGTGKEAPGEGYACAFKYDTKGNGSEWEAIKIYAGWQCRKYEGCACGNTTCHPGEVCATNQDNTRSCVPCKNISSFCLEHRLPLSYIYGNGYGCYDDNRTKKYTEGWYCHRPEGCACGDVMCEQWQMCVSPGNCSTRKLDSEIEQNKLHLPLEDNIHALVDQC